MGKQKNPRTFYLSILENVIEGYQLCVVRCHSEFQIKCEFVVILRLTFNVVTKESCVSFVFIHCILCHVTSDSKTLIMHIHIKTIFNFNWLLARKKHQTKHTSSIVVIGCLPFFYLRDTDEVEENIHF